MLLRCSKITIWVLGVAKRETKLKGREAHCPGMAWKGQKQGFTEEYLVPKPCFLHRTTISLPHGRSGGGWRNERESEGRSWSKAVPACQQRTYCHNALCHVPSIRLTLTEEEVSDRWRASCLAKWVSSLDSPMQLPVHIFLQLLSFLQLKNDVFLAKCSFGPGLRLLFLIYTMLLGLQLC